MAEGEKARRREGEKATTAYMRESDPALWGEHPQEYHAAKLLLGLEEAAPGVVRYTVWLTCSC